MKVLAIVLGVSFFIVMFTVFLGTILTMNMESKENDVDELIKFGTKEQLKKWRLTQIKENKKNRT